MSNFYVLRPIRSCLLLYYCQYCTLVLIILLLPVRHLILLLYLYILYYHYYYYYYFSQPLGSRSPTLNDLLFFFLQIIVGGPFDPLSFYIILPFIFLYSYLSGHLFPTSEALVKQYHQTKVKNLKIIIIMI
jgi:hypothetical protein